MELNQINAFISVVREGNFTRAADKLNLTQPAVSQRIANLEAELGGLLLERSSRPLRLTPLGKRFLPFAKRMMSVLADCQRVVTQYQTGQVGHVSIVALNNFAYFMLREPMQIFRKQHPAVDMSIRIRNPRELLDLLYDGNAALGLMEGPIWDSGLQVHARFRFQVLPVASPHHPLAKQTYPLRLSDLFEHTLFRATLNPSATAVIEQMAEQARRGSGGAVLWMPAIMVIHSLLESRGVAMLPQQYVQNHVAKGDLVFLDVQDLPMMVSQPTVVSLADSQLDSHALRFIQLICSQWADMLAE